MTAATQTQPENQIQPKEKQDVYAAITNQIIADLEKGQLTWRKPWSSEHLAENVCRPLRWNDQPYNGINTMMLWAAAADKGYKSPYWMTYNQALELKAHVKKGEKSTQVVYADKILKDKRQEEGAAQEVEQKQEYVPFLKLYFVFNAEQIEGLGERFYNGPEPKESINCDSRIFALEEFFKQTKADIRHGGNRAYYSQDQDYIKMPHFETFESAQAYYATLAHEMTHWTKHETRLKRNLGGKKKGDEGYAKEELVAELGACFLAADLGFQPKSIEQHSAYIQSWLKTLKDDKKFIFTAANQAGKASEFLHSMQI